MLQKSCQSSGAFVTTEVAEERGSLFEWKGSIISSGLGPERSIFHVWQFPSGGGGLPTPGVTWSLPRALDWPEGTGKVPCLDHSPSLTIKKELDVPAPPLLPVFLRGTDIDIP